MSTHDPIEPSYEIYAHTVTEMKHLLLDMKSKHGDIDWREKAEELEKELKSLKKNKNYGLFWKEKREEFDTKTQDALPVLKEVHELAISQDDTQSNIVIEGDNYHTLSVLSYTHKGKIDVIYIDPPYNTGNKDFIYNDRYVDKEDDFRHSKWLSFMQKRLNLAKDLLKDTGVIFISIDYNEYAQLKLLCDDILGEVNLLNDLIWKKKKGGGNDSVHIANEHEYILLYARDKSKLGPLFVNYGDKYLQRYKESDKVGSFFWDTFKRKSGKQYYPVSCPDGTVLEYDEFGNKISWLRSKKRFDQDLKIGDVRIVKIGDKWSVQFKQRLPEGKKPRSIIDEFGTTSTGNDELFGIFASLGFSNPKPSTLIKYLLEITTSDNSLILDFFAGSGTTGHAVLELNKEDGGNRRFILCSNRENTSEYPDKNICRDITYERVKRVATGYTNSKGESIEGLGGNIRYLETDFIPKHKGTDNLRNRMVERCSEMLCLKENIWESFEDISDETMRFYMRGDRYLAVLFGLFRFEEFSEKLRRLDKPVSIYVFSRGQMTVDDFEDITVPYTVEEIPDPILAVYKNIFGL